MGSPSQAACWCVHDDITYLSLSLSSFSDITQRVVFVSKLAWRGAAGDWKSGVNLAKAAGVEVVIGEYPDESLHRRAALAEMKRRGFEFLLIPDGDEIIQKPLLDQLVRIAGADAADSVRCRMDTFWKGPEYVIRPREELAPLIMLRLENAEHVHIREYSAGKRELTLSPEFGVLLHLSYAGSADRILRKISSWGHREEVRRNWFEEVYLAWDNDHTMRDLHPTHPRCYGFAERIEIPRELIGAESYAPALPTPPVLANWPKVSIVIPLHGGEEIVRNCLASLAKLTDLIFEVIVVDDQSPDRAADVVEAEGGVTLIRNEMNIGFGQTCNRGYEASSGDVVIFLNSDTVFPRSGLSRLVETLMSSGTVGAAGPMSNNVGYHQMTPVTYTSASTIDFFADDFAYRKAKDFEVNMLVGFCLAVRRTALEECGAFDPLFGVGMFEDNDLCYRLLRAGYKLKVSARAFVHHEGSQSLMLRREHPTRLMARNRENFLRKWSSDLETGYASHLSGFGPDPIVFDPAKSPERMAEEIAELRDRANISLCLIVKNEERVIRDCLISALPFFKQIIVVDTGSADRTKEICHELGVEVYDFVWTDSFSAARNESLRHATGKWCFYMDADDTLPYACGRHLLEVAIQARSEVIGFVVPVRFTDNGQGATQVDHVKLFRNIPGIRFDFRIHEQILPSLQQIGGEIARSMAYVVHSGYDISPEGQAAKRERDYRILALDLAEQGEQPFVLFNYGMTDRYTNLHERAVDWLERSIAAACGEGSQLRKSYSLLAESLRALGKETEALKVVFAGLDAVGEDPELRFQAGIILAGAGRFEEAKEQYLSMTSGNDGHYSSVNSGIFGALREHNLAVCCHGLSDYAGARSWWLKALARRPLYMESLQALWTSAFELEDFRTLRELVDLTRFANGEGEVWAQFGCAYAQAVEGDGGPERFLNRAVAMNPQASGVRLTLTRVLISQKRMGEAYPHLLVLTENGVAEAFDHLCVLAIYQGRLVEALGLIERALDLEPGNNSYLQQATQLREALKLSA